jgi:hypothetical protein
MIGHRLDLFDSDFRAGRSNLSMRSHLECSVNAVKFLVFLA